MAAGNDPSGRAGFRVSQSGPGEQVVVSNAREDGTYRSFYYEWLTPEGEPLPQSQGGGPRSYSPPPAVAELTPPKGAGVLRLHGPLERKSVKLK